MTTATHTHPLVATIAEALDAGDRDALAALFAPDPTYLSVGGANPPSAPLLLRGDAVREYVRGIPATIRMTLEDHIVGADGRVWVRTLCVFPEGGSAVSSHIVTLDDEGRIATQQCVEAVDA